MSISCRHSVLKAINFATLDFSNVTLEVQTNGTSVKINPDTPPKGFPPGQVIDIRKIEMDEKFVVTIDARVGNTIWRGIRSAPIENPVFVLMQAMCINTDYDVDTAWKNGVIHSLVVATIYASDSIQDHMEQVDRLKRQKALIKDVYLYGSRSGESKVDMAAMEKGLALYREVMIDSARLSRSVRVEDAVAVRAATILGCCYTA